MVLKKKLTLEKFIEAIAQKTFDIFNGKINDVVKSVGLRFNYNDVDILSDGEDVFLGGKSTVDTVDFYVSDTLSMINLCNSEKMFDSKDELLSNLAGYIIATVVHELSHHDQYIPITKIHDSESINDYEIANELNNRYFLRDNMDLVKKVYPTVDFDLYSGGCIYIGDTDHGIFEDLDVLANEHGEYMKYRNMYDALDNIFESVLCLSYPLMISKGYNDMQIRVINRFKKKDVIFAISFSEIKELNDDEIHDVMKLFRDNFFIDCIFKAEIYVDDKDKRIYIQAECLGASNNRFSSFGIKPSVYYNGKDKDIIDEIDSL